MTDGTDSVDLKKYLDDLYLWITNLYNETRSGQVSEEEYKTQLEYYNSEVERVTNSLISEKKKSKKKKGISPELIEKFFQGSDESFSKSISIAANFREVSRNGQGKTYPKNVRDIHHNTSKSQDLPVKEDKKVTMSTPLEEPHSSPEETPSHLERDFSKYKVVKPTPIGTVRSPNIVSNETDYVKYSPSMSNITSPPLGSHRISKISDFHANQISKPLTSSEHIVKEVSTSLVDKVLSDSHTAGEKQINLVLLGNSSVGRTSIRRAIMGKNFIKQHLSTVGASMDEKTLEFDGELIKFTIMDLGGQDFYASVRANFYRNIQAAVIVFDLNDRSTFIQVDKWILELYQNTRDKAVPFILVGNKSDLKRQVKKEDGMKLAENLSKQVAKYGFKVPYLEVSAKKNEGIREIFATITRLLNLVA